MKQVRSLSQQDNHAQEATLGSIQVFTSLEDMYSSEGPCSPVTRSVQDMCCIIHSSTPLSVTATICVGYHVVILFRHTAYDVCGSVTADVTFPIGAINKPSAAMACCGLHSCPNKQFNQFVWINLWEPRVQWHDFESLWSRKRRRKKKFGFHLAGLSMKVTTRFNSCSFFLSQKSLFHSQTFTETPFHSTAVAFFSNWHHSLTPKMLCTLYPIYERRFGFEGWKKCVFHF